MHQHITVIPSDHLIIVDGVPLRFDFPAPESLHALQWHKDAGHLEYADGRPNVLLSEGEYGAAAAPYAALWEAEKARLDAEAEAAEAARLAEYSKPENARARKLEEINAKCQAALAALSAGYPDRELLTFDKQEAEARAYLADPAGAATPILNAIAEGRGIPPAELAHKIVAKADAFSLASGALIGRRQKYEDQLDALGADATTAQIEAVTVSYGLPGAEGGEA